jgi:hypothetical protein
MGYAKHENVPAKVKVAIACMLEQKADLQAAALHSGVTTGRPKNASVHEP